MCNTLIIKEKKVHRRSDNDSEGQQINNQAYKQTNEQTNYLAKIKKE